MMKHWLVKSVIVLAMVFFQVVAWQTSLVIMAYVHSAMHYATAVDLLNNRPSYFYLIIAIPLLLSNALLLICLAILRKVRQRA